MGFLVLEEPGLLVREVDKSVRGTTSREYRRPARLHYLEEYLLPDLDGNTLHG